ncbi:MAG: hypothetical protein WDN04_13000 [Rhodospirillales bacterium]
MARISTTLKPVSLPVTVGQHEGRAIRHDAGAQGWLRRLRGSGHDQQGSENGAHRAAR